MFTPMTLKRYRHLIQSLVMLFIAATLLTQASGRSVLPTANAASPAQIKDAGSRPQNAFNRSRSTNLQASSDESQVATSLLPSDGTAEILPTTTLLQPLAETRHPLDPLTADEYSATLDILRAANKINDATRFPLVTLHEPDKQSVLTWALGKPLSRAAFAIVKQGTQTFEAVVDLKTRRLQSWREMPGVQPSLLFEENIIVQDIALQDPAFRKALAARGITDVSKLLCVPLTVGYFNIPEEEGRRLMRVPCFYTEGSVTQLFTRPIEGLFALVDLNTKSVVKVIDTGVRPVPQHNYELTEAAAGELRKPMKPVKISQPEGSNIKVNGNVINWDTWSFHQRLDKRTGLIISQVQYKDGDTPRSVLYQGSLSEVFVPYMDPDVGWYWRTFMDAGEYGFGLFATPLAAGIDCPDTATFLGAVLADDNGRAMPMDRVICIFERPTGDPAWRHFETFNGAYEGRPAVELVTRMIATVGNYDYILDWVFSQDGKIKVRVGATGIDITKGVYSTSMHDATAPQDTAYGTLVAPNLVAVNHDHYFNFRLDLDVDGPQNSFELSEFEPKAVANNPRTSIWQMKSRILQTESEAKLNHDPTRPAAWEVINENSHRALDHHSGYTLMPLNSAVTNIMSPQDYPVRRAAFSLYNLWVTPYNRNEQYAGGVYVNQSKGGDGLPAWTQANRSIVDRDIVLWYNAGLRHEPHMEDWPVMPMVWLEFQLAPHNFFDRNPALNLRRP
jgi:primary-amine oxidase